LSVLLLMKAKPNLMILLNKKYKGANQNEYL